MDHPTVDVSGSLHQFEEGEVYKIDELPENEMNKSGKLEWVDDNTLALIYEDQVLEFESSHVRCTDIKHITDDGEIVEERE